MVANGLSLQPHCIVEIIHYLPVTDKRRTFDSSLELVSRIQDESMSGILILNLVYKPCHVLQTSIGIILFGVFSLHEGR